MEDISLPKDIKIEFMSCRKKSDGNNWILPKSNIQFRYTVAKTQNVTQNKNLIYLDVYYWYSTPIKGTNNYSEHEFTGVFKIESKRHILLTTTSNELPSIFATMLHYVHEFCKNQLEANGVPVQMIPYKVFLTQATSDIRNNNNGLMNPLQN